MVAGMLFRFASVAFALSLSIARADTVPCTHRFVETKVREYFNYVQAKPDVNTGVRAVNLEGVREVRQHRLSEPDVLIRYCAGNLRLDRDLLVPVHFRVASRSDYKRDRAEDIQTCWADPKYGAGQAIDQSLGCKTGE
jgi:hypothetical protein